MRHLTKSNENRNNLDFFEDFFKPLNYQWFDNTESKSSGFYPPVNVQETEDNFKLEIVAPGMDKADFKIKTEGDILTISVEKKEEKKEDSEKHIRREYNYRSFKRSFTLDDDIDQENVAASYENGVLQLTLPKKEEKIVKPKEIAVK
ncbi:MAG TPA: Hsp20/alpha crystallin family protein [Chitinophagaceae bacterium]|nr:Hsp20/alpha crystallin family protein [Chitinophagaceae bacterium]